VGSRGFSIPLYTEAKARFVPEGDGPVTRVAEQRAHRTGKLDELVDPAGYGVVRRSLLRFEQRPDGLYELTVGTSVPNETRVDTTGSMGDNVDIAMEVLPSAYELCSQVLPGCDLHLATGIFGDVQDRFVLCRPQFEMLAEKIVQQLTLMVPERDGGDATEDPQYGLFGGAYLVAAYINRIGLKRYDFTVSDAQARERLSETQLTRVFGKEVFDKATANGHPIDYNDLPSTKEVVADLLKEAHGFFLQVGNSIETTLFWTRMFGPERVIHLPRTKLLPQVQAAIIGLTEGTLGLDQVKDFLTNNNVSPSDASAIVRSVSNIPIGAQAALPNYGKKPQKGGLFRDKTDLWPIDPSEVPTLEHVAAGEPVSGPDWL
jgi:hypothetical protein